MSKQIVITEGDYGIELYVQFLDSTKEPVILSNCTVEIDFVSPEEEITTKEATIINDSDGSCSYVLQATETNVAGLWKTYWKIKENTTLLITAQEEIYYYVREKDGGVV